MLGARWRSQASATCIGVAPSRVGDLVQLRRLQRREAAEREERHIGDSGSGELVDQGVVLAMRHIVQILHADDVADPPPLFDLIGGDVAQPNVTHEALPLKIGEDRERRLDRPFRGPVDRRP